jgi:hypothetical protein
MIDLGLRTSHLYCAFKLRVQIECSGDDRWMEATSFFVKTSNDTLVLVTNRHVLDPPFAGILDGKVNQVTLDGFNYRQDVHEDQAVGLLAFRPTPVFSADTSVDIACIPLTQFCMAPGSAITIDGWIGEDLLASEGEFDSDISAGDFVCAPGYIKLPDTSGDRPVFLVGIIASDPRLPATITYRHPRSPDEGLKAVLYQSLSRAGLSGAPVFAPQRGLDLGNGLIGPPHRGMRLVGVNTGHFQEWSTGLPLQYSHFVRSVELLSLLANL